MSSTMQTVQDTAGSRRRWPRHPSVSRRRGRRWRPAALAATLMLTLSLGVPSPASAASPGAPAATPATADAIVTHGHGHGRGHHHGHHLPLWDLVSAVIGTARYHDLPAATRAGYAAFPEGVPLHECIDEDVDLDDADGKPAMGVHWVNGALLDDHLDAAHPEVLVYEPRPNGRLRLVALEYVVFESAWGSPGITAPPRLFGRALQYVPAPNRYDLPAFYEIHSWIWKGNPDGLFANMNPRASCRYA